MIAERRRRESEGKRSVGKKSVIGELRGLFKGGTRKVAWKHTFVCLAMRNQEKVPTCDAEKDELFEAGLWEKEVCFNSLELDAEGFREVILENFPKLREGGGYQLCKCLPNSRRLEPLSVLAHSSPLMLKQRVGTARTYIRPLQRDLDLLPDTESVREEVSV